jgi:hypothetical protein
MKNGATVSVIADTTASLVGTWGEASSGRQARRESRDPPKPFCNRLELCYHFFSIKVRMRGQRASPSGRAIHRP